MPVMRAISRWGVPRSSSVRIVACLLGFKTFTPWPSLGEDPVQCVLPTGAGGAGLYLLSPINSGGGVCGGHQWGNLGGLRGSDEARRNGINTLCFHFDCLLGRDKSPGVVLIDRFNDKKLDQHLTEKVSIGLTGNFPFSRAMKINNIVGYHIASIGQSHFCSLVDVVLGSLRFSINAFTQNKKEHEKSARLILQQLSPLFFREKGGISNGEKVHPISLWFSPKDVRHPKYREMYIALREYFEVNGIGIEQSI